MRVLFRIFFLGLILFFLVGFLAFKMEGCNKPQEGNDVNENSLGIWYQDVLRS